MATVTGQALLQAMKQVHAVLEAGSLLQGI